MLGTYNKKTVPPSESLPATYNVLLALQWYLCWHRNGENVESVGAEANFVGIHNSSFATNTMSFRLVLFQQGHIHGTKSKTTVHVS